MLEALRRGATSWWAKILFPLLILSFAVWGVADVFRGFGQDSLAKVGTKEISATQFQQALQNEIETISRQAKRRITQDEARMFGLDQQVLSRLIGQAAIDEHVKKLNLGISDAAIVEEIMREQSFKDIDGKFSRGRFEGFLRQIGYSEQGFINLKRGDDIRGHLTSSIISTVAVPRVLVDVMHAHKEQTRVIEHTTIDASKITVGEPDEAKLKEAFEANKTQFRSPQYRKLAVLMLPFDEIKGKITVSDEEAKAAWDADKEEFTVPEKRRVQQIAFKTRSDAENARNAIVSGKSFAEVAKESGAKDADIDLGLVTERQMIDPKIAAAAFKLEKDKVSDVVEGRFTTVLLRVTEIQAGKNPTFEEMKTRVKDRIAARKAKEQVGKLHDDVDDNRGAGKTLADISGTFKLPFHEIAATDKQNKTPDGKRALDVTNGDIVVLGAFDAKSGVEHEAIELPDGGYAWVDVLSTIEEKQKPYEEVAADVKAVYLTAEKKRLVAELAAKLVERASAGEDFAKIAADAGGKADATLAVTRTTLPQGLTQAAVNQAFAMAQGKAGSADTADGGSRIVFRVKEVREAPPATDDQIKRMESDLKASLQNDALTAYVAALQDRAGVNINETVLKRATGASREQ